MRLLFVLAVPLVAARVIGARQAISTVEVESVAPAIGIHLTTSYAVAAIRHENGDFEDLVRIPASAEYIELMAYYNDKSGRLDCRLENPDRNRALCEMQQSARYRNTGRVAVLSSFLSEIKSAIEDKLSTTITDVMTAFPPLASIDRSDFKFAFSHVGLRSLHVQGHWPYLLETNAAYASFGYGLSEDPRLDSQDTELQPENNEAVLFLDFDNSSFSAVLQHLQNPYQRHRLGKRTDLELGWWNLPVHEMYELERQAHFDKIYTIISSILENMTMRPPKKIILLGDHAKEEEFLQVVRDVIGDRWQFDASLLLEANDGVDSGTVAARGAAELAFRALLRNTGDRLGKPLLSQSGEPKSENMEL